MKGEKGVCSTALGNGMFNLRTTFSNEVWCKEALQTLIDLKVIPANSVVYQCKKCKLWHFGSLELATKFKLL